LIKYTKSVLWRVAKRLSYIEDARCLKVKVWAECTVLGEKCGNNSRTILKVENTLLSQKEQVVAPTERRID